MKVSIDDLANEIANILSEYTQEVEEGLEKAKEETAKEAVNHLKSFSKPRLTGRYLSGWVAKKVGTDIVIYNKNRPSLTHLLEHGHAKRGGGRVAGYPHIRPTEEEAIKYYEKAVEKVIKG